MGRMDRPGGKLNIGVQRWCEIVAPAAMNLAFTMHRNGFLVGTMRCC
jgi:hypothetical protein